MAWEAIVHEAVWKEIEPAAREEVRAAMRAVAGLKEPARSPSVKPLGGTEFNGAYRLRVGRHRVLFILFPDVGTIAFMAAFLKKREADYARAVARFSARVRSYE